VVVPRDLADPETKSHVSDPVVKWLTVNPPSVSVIDPRP